MTTTEQPATLVRNADINKLCPPHRVHDDTLYAQWVINCARILDPTDDALTTEAEKDAWNAWKVEAEDCARWLAERTYSRSGRLTVDQLDAQIRNRMRIIDQLQAGRIPAVDGLTVEQDIAGERETLAGYVDLLHAYALIYNARSMVAIEITGSEHGRGTRIVQPCRMEDGYICGVTGTTECTATEAQQRTCPVC